jgi:hypothetical protein
MAARFTPARMTFGSGSRTREFVSNIHTNFYIKMERYWNEHH